MKCIGIFGNAYAPAREVRDAVCEFVQDVARRGDQMVLVGDLGVSLYAMVAAEDLNCISHLKVILPMSRSDFVEHYCNAADNGEACYDEVALLCDMVEALPSDVFEVVSDLDLARSKMLDMVDALHVFRLTDNKDTYEIVEQTQQMNVESVVHSFQ